jgi:carbon starvation protein CstA
VTGHDAAPGDTGRPGAARVGFALARLVLAIAIVAAIVGQLTRSLGYWDARGDEDIPGDLVNFFSYFTMESNAAAAVTLAIGAVLLLRRRGPDPRWFAVLHLLVATYMVTTGIVYNLLLRSMPLDPGLAQPWSNEILHLVVPVYLLLDRLFAPGNRRLSFATVGVVGIYPIVWAVYTLGRAPLIMDQSTDRLGWYPYPFLDPRLADGGFGSVMTWVVVLLSMIAVIGFVLLVIARLRARFARRSA